MGMHGWNDSGDWLWMSLTMVLWAVVLGAAVYFGIRAAHRNDG
jgi:hypothetical protein